MAATRTFNTDTRGFTLTELLVGMLLTLVVTGGALLAFSQAIRATDMAKLRLGMGDQVRIGLDLMTRDFIQIGNGLPNGKVMPVPNGVGATAIHRPGPTLADFTLATTTDLSAVIPGAQLGPGDQRRAVGRDLDALCGPGIRQPGGRAREPATLHDGQQRPVVRVRHQRRHHVGSAARR